MVGYSDSHSVIDIWSAEFSVSFVVLSKDPDYDIDADSIVAQRDQKSFQGFPGAVGSIVVN
jgi:hypothetical protein